MRKKILLGFILIVIVVLAFIFLRFQKNALPVQSAAVEEGRISEKIFASGKLEAVQTYSQFAETNGRIEKVLVKQGDQVKKGQPLVTFNTADIESQIQDADNNLKVLELERAKSLKDQEESRNKQFNEFKKQQFDEQGQADPASATIIGKIDVSLEDAKISNQQFKLEELKRNLQKLKITANGDGTVTEVSVEEGQSLTVGSKIAVVTDTGKLRVRAQAGELDAAKIKPDMAATITGDSFSQTYTGKVSYISPVAVLSKSASNSASNSTSNETSVELLVTIDQADAGEIKPGYNVIVQFELQGQPALLLPLHAVAHEGGKSYVYKSVNGKAAKVEVKTGKESDDKVEILEGLNVGDKVIANITPGLKEGRKVVMR